ncbi:hypothetical protein T07_8526 [Trichinella nelsoni]|uniref:Uncharacterized protein n=1 Tax=Trichinella nelsoni TaxID=6336 RepID=A0A0V0RD76_9BILA|nr:hypothetical protein T07_8526 [Trichinella nelsoni]
MVCFSNCFASQKSGLSFTTFRLFNLFPFTEVRAHLRICVVDRFAISCQDFLLLHLGFYTCFASQNSERPMDMSS